MARSSAAGARLSAGAHPAALSADAYAALVGTTTPPARPACVVEQYLDPTHGTLRVELLQLGAAAQPRGLRLPIDLLFSSLALEPSGLTLVQASHSAPLRLHELNHAAARLPGGEQAALYGERLTRFLSPHSALA